MGIPVELLMQHSDIICIDGRIVTYVGIAEAIYQNRARRFLRFKTYDMGQQIFNTPYVQELDLDEKGEVFLLTSRHTDTFTHPFSDAPTKSKFNFYHLVPLSESSVLMSTLGVR